MHITVTLVVLRLSLYTSQSPWCPQTIHTLITVSLVVLRLFLFSSQSLWWYSEYPYTHHSLPSGTQIITILITDILVILSLYIHHSLPGGPQTIPIHITVSLDVLRLSLFSSQSPWWSSDYPYVVFQGGGHLGCSMYRPNISF